MILLLDNYDSFTYNIVQYLEQLQAEVIVYKSDAIDIAGIQALNPNAIVLGPGPGTPDDAGIMLDCIKEFAGKLPMLGVCLGHQAIAQAFGANIVRAQQVMHGRTSMVYHHKTGVFNTLPCPTKVTRYHSLLVDKATLPDTLVVTAWTPQPVPHNPACDYKANCDADCTADREANNKTGDVYEIMGIRHKTYAMEGVQFHPESILSDSGLPLFKNFLRNHQLL